jgi:hypothetical protein
VLAWALPAVRYQRLSPAACRAAVQAAARGRESPPRSLMIGAARVCEPAWWPIAMRSQYASPLRRHPLRL